MSPSNYILQRQNDFLRAENERLRMENTQAYLALRVIRPGPIGRWLLKREMRKLQKKATGSRP